MKLINPLFFRKYNRLFAYLFLGLTIVFIIAAAINKDFLDWIFARHHNQLSWYIRPIFLIPFCYFAYKRNLAGIMATIFALVTSMVWFPRPEQVSLQVKEFLQFEVDYLTGDWGYAKILMTMLVPISLTALALAFWKRNLRIGLLVVVFMALAKMTWSVVFAGEAGTSIFIPAILGLLFCVVLIYFGFIKMGSR